MDICLLIIICDDSQKALNLDMGLNKVYSCWICIHCRWRGYLL